MGHKNLKDPDYYVGWQSPSIPMSRRNSKSPRRGRSIRLRKPNLTAAIAMEASLGDCTQTANRDIDIAFLVSPHTP